MLFQGKWYELVGLIMLAAAVIFFVSIDSPANVAQAQVVDQFVWPDMPPAKNIGNGVYFYEIVFKDIETVSKVLADFKKAHPNIRITAMTAVMHGSLIVNCERIE